MYYEEEAVKAAYLLHQTLMVQGSLSKKDYPELYRSYFEPNIRDILHNVFQPISQSKIIYVDETLYFVPDIDNEIFTYKNEELRVQMGLKDNKELYMAQFIWINVISEFYGDQFNQTNQTRTFVKVDEIMSKVKGYIEKFSEKSEEELYELSAEYELDILGLIQVWNNLSVVTEEVKDVSRATSRDYGFFLKVLRFWEKEKLIIVREKEEISLTSKMKNIVGTYYHHEDRINKIKELLNESFDEGEKVYA